MKKTGLLLLFLLIFLCLFSCGQRYYDILSYQEKRIEAQCLINDKFDVVIKKDGENYSLEVISPSEAKGTVFEYNGNECYAVSGEIKIPLNKDDLRGIVSLFNMFGLKESDIVSTEGKNIVLFENGYGKYRVTYGDMKVPTYIEIESSEYEYKVQIPGIKLTDYAKK